MKRFPAATRALPAVEKKKPLFEGGFETEQSLNGKLHHTLSTMPDTRIVALPVNAYVR